MTRKLSLSLHCVCLCGLPAALAVFFAVQNNTRAADEPPANLSPSIYLTTLGKKFYGSGTCSGDGPAAQCHNLKTAVVNNPNYWGNEYGLWHDKKDPHHKAFKTLLDPKSKPIADKLKIASAKASARCLNCHATLATGPGGKDLKGPQYTAFEGVSCNSCHGPAQDYITPHPTKGWIDEQRKALNNDHLAVLKKFGLYDTVPLVYRAERCTSCHLAIEPELVAAGHPQTTFEMNFFSNPAIYTDLHWHESPETSTAGIWAAGQLSELHDALIQLQLYAGFYTAHPSPDALKQLVRAYYQALAHYTVFHVLFETQAVASPDMAAIDADIKTLQASLNNMVAFGKAAEVAAGHIETPGLEKAIGDFKKPDAATAKKVLAAMAKPDLGVTFLVDGAEQQILGIAAFAEAAGLKPVSDAVAPLVPKTATALPDPAALTKALPDIRAKIGG